VRRALISDIHGNLEALEAVLSDIEAQRVNEIFCLGDVVGYGPNPCECIDRVMENCRVTILGSHEQAVLSDPARSKGPSDRAAAGWTWHQLIAPIDRAANEVRKGFLMHLPRTYEIGPYLFVHGSPRDPLSEYVFPEDIFNRRKMEHLFSLVTHYCFQGHTHVPGIITADLRHIAPDEIDGEYSLDDRKMMINVGSVGQPRDGDPGPVM
jgi:diadenosine tetraphosphatase ApaH/serine/threonine PP2A family protein phosphatase